MATISKIVLVILTASCTMVLVQGKSYELVATKMDWETASCYCQGKGHTLPVIESAAEQQALQSYLEQLRTTECFLGDWISIWTDGQRITLGNSGFVWKVSPTIFLPLNYINWRRGQPNNGGASGKEACMNLWHLFKWRWNDVNCSNKMCFVCEVKD